MMFASMSESLGEANWLLLQLFYSVIVAFVATNLLQAYRKSRETDLPGPWNLPLIGSLHHLGRRPYISLTRMREKYGDVFRIQIGTEPFVVLNGLSTIRKALGGQAEVFAGRPTLHTFGLISEGKSMTFNSWSPDLKVHRKMAERALKIISGNPTFMEEVVHQEINKLIDVMQEKGKSPYYPLNDIMWAVAHIKYSLCYGRSREDKDFKPMVDRTMAVLNSHDKGNIVNFCAWLKVFLPKSYTNVGSLCDSAMTLIKKKQRDHLKEYGETGQVRDILDALIKLGVHGNAEVPLDQDRVLHTVQEYIGAGLDIIYVTFTWLVLYMAQFPDIQRRVQKEVDDVIGSRRPSVRDLAQMPYTEACMLETLRHSCVTPFGLPHSTLEDTSLDGKFIKKNSFVLVNFYSVSRDESLWEDADQFRPERFLHQGVIDRTASSQWISHSLGKRRCLGEQFSKQEIFLFMTTLLQRCDIVKPPHVDQLSTIPDFGVVLKPQPFEVLVRTKF